MRARLRRASDPEPTFGTAHGRALAGETFSFETVSAGRRLSVRATPRHNAAGAIVGGSLLSVDLDLTADESQTGPAQLAPSIEHDVLTGLPNRALYLDRLGQALLHARGRDEHVGVCFVDLDHFKQVNDSFGHATGDEILRTLARRARSALRPQDTVARHGSDELKVLLPALAGREAAAELAHRIAHACAEPVHVGGRQVVVGCSIGVAVAPDDGRNAELLLSRAETAMQRAKELGRDRVETFDRELARRGEARVHLEHRLRAAVEGCDLHLVYQPQVDAHGVYEGVEALVRWHPDGRDAVPPGEFIPLAEATGLIRTIGSWVLREACRASAALRARGGAPLRMCVNLSPNQLADPALSALVAGTLAELRLPPHLLELELTESALMLQGEDAFERLRELRALGVRISLDDFGTGYSSLARLRELPLDALKIDRSFIAEIGLGSGSAIVGSIIELGHTLGLEVVAEGIETSEQRRIVQSLGIDRMQGYLIGRPKVELRPPQMRGAA